MPLVMVVVVVLGVGLQGLKGRRLWAYGVLHIWRAKFPNLFKEVLLSSVRPAGFKMVGNSVDVGCHSFTRVISFSISLQLSFTKTFPGADHWNRKCWYDLIPFRAVWRKWE